MKKLLFLSIFLPLAGMAQVGVGTTSPQAKLHIQGDLRVDSMRTIGTSDLKVVLDTATNKLALQATRPQSDTLVRISAKTSGNSIPHLTSTRIIWSATDINTVPSAWNTTTGVFTAPRQGIYRITAQLTFNPNAANNAEHTVVVRKNGSDFAVAGNFDSSGGNSVYKPTGNVNALIELNAGETASVWAFQGAGSTQTLYNAVWNYMSIEELP